MRAFSLLSLAGLAFAFTLAQGQALQGPGAPAATPGFELKDGKRDQIDLGLKLRAISGGAGADLAQFKGKKAMIYYFSAKCPHCQQNVGHVQRLADELASQGVSSAAVAIKYNTDDEIRGFIRDYGVRVPVLQDDNRAFGDRWGVGTVPVLYLLNEKGEYIRYTRFAVNQTPEQIRNAVSWNAAAAK